MQLTKDMTGDFEELSFNTASGKSLHATRWATNDEGTNGAEFQYRKR